MSRDEIIKLAREVGYPLVSIGGNPYIPPLLAVLLGAAVEAEREACLRECRFGRSSADIEIAIRERGEK
jgi:hypothetical protein